MEEDLTQLFGFWSESLRVGVLVLWFSRTDPREKNISTQKVDSKYTAHARVVASSKTLCMPRLQTQSAALPS